MRQSYFQLILLSPAQTSLALDLVLIVNLCLSFREQGVKGLYKGLEAKLLQTVSTAALMFVAYEKIAAFIFRLLRTTQR